MGGVELDRSSYMWAVQGVLFCRAWWAVLKSCCIFLKTLDSVDKTDLGCIAQCVKEREMASVLKARQEYLYPWNIFNYLSLHTVSRVFQRLSLPFVRSYFSKSLGLSPFWQYWSSNKARERDGKKILQEAGKFTIFSNLKCLIIFQLEHPCLSNRWVTWSILMQGQCGKWKDTLYLPNNTFQKQTKNKHCCISFLTWKTNVGWFWLPNATAKLFQESENARAVSLHRLIPTSVMEALSQHSKLRTSVGDGG